jgi:hypothetical protein
MRDCAVIGAHTPPHKSHFLAIQVGYSSHFVDRMDTPFCTAILGPIKEFSPVAFSCLLLIFIIRRRSCVGNTMGRWQKCQQRESSGKGRQWDSSSSEGRAGQK